MLGSFCWDRSLLQFEILVLICELYSRQVVLEVFSLKVSAGAIHWSCEGTVKYQLGYLDYIFTFVQCLLLWAWRFFFEV
jgi:hypothetical protein